jgi:hypothetical protein
VTPSTGGTGPLRVSTRNRRYFETAAGQIVYLTGSHTWSNLQDNGTTDPPPVFNYTAYLDFLVAHGHNFFRLWTWEQAKWTDEISVAYWFSAGPYPRPGPGTAMDGKPKFDLTVQSGLFRPSAQQGSGRGSTRDLRLHHAIRWLERYNQTRFRSKQPVERPSVQFRQ